MTPSQITRLRTLAEARLAFVSYGKLTFSPASQKAVLVVLAAFEGKRISMRALAERCGMSEAGAFGIVRGHLRTGMIRRDGPSHFRAYAYAINWGALEGRAAASPLVGTPGICKPVRKVHVERPRAMNLALAEAEHIRPTGKIPVGPDIDRLGI